MIYTGNHLFHYTNFESALKIIATRSLKFGNFEDMNDIAEANREVFGMVDDGIIYRALSEYHSISLTLDNSAARLMVTTSSATARFSNIINLFDSSTPLYPPSFSSCRSFEMWEV